MANENGGVVCTKCGWCGYPTGCSYTYGQLTCPECKYAVLQVFHPSSAAGGEVPGGIEVKRCRLVPELPSGWVPPFRQASSGVSSHVIDSAVPANWIGDDTVEVSKFLAELLNAVYLPSEGEVQPCRAR